MGSLVDVADGRLMDGDGDLEAGVGSATTLQKKCSNPRGCNAKHNLPLGAQMVAERVVEVSLACAPRTMEEEGLPCLVCDRRTDLLKGSLLSKIKPANVLLCKSSLLPQVILQLLPEKWVPSPGCPVPCDLWHAVPILKPLPRVSKELINEIKTIILDFFLGWMIPQDTCMMALQIITNVDPMVVPKCPWISRSTVLEDGHK
jgi:hypothetical protein